MALAMLESSAQSNSDSSLLLWMLAAVLALFAAHVALGWIREVQRQKSFRDSWKGLLSAAVAMGSGISGSVVLALSAEALTFPLGYSLQRALVLWAAAILGSLPSCFWLARKNGVLASLVGGALLAAVAVAVQSSWVVAVGFRPGITWRMEFLAAAFVFLLIGLSGAFWVAFSEPSKAGRRRRLWRVGGTALLGLSLVAGQEVLMAGAGLLAQVGSVYKDQLPAAIASLVAGVVVPLGLLVMAIDLDLRRRQRRRHRTGKDSPTTLSPLTRRHGTRPVVDP